SGDLRSRCRRGLETRAEHGSTQHSGLSTQDLAWPLRATTRGHTQKPAFFPRKRPLCANSLFCAQGGWTARNRLICRLFSTARHFALWRAGGAHSSETKPLAAPPPPAYDSHSYQVPPPRLGRGRRRIGKTVRIRCGAAAVIGQALLLISPATAGQVPR